MTSFNPLSGPEPGETETRAMLYTYRNCFNPLSGPEPGETGEDNRTASEAQFQSALRTGARRDTERIRHQWISDGVSIRSPDRSPERPARARERASG